MRTLLSYILSFSLLFIFLINSQGLFIEHHECTSCDDDLCEITTEHSVDHKHDSNCNSCTTEHQKINISDIHSCNIYDFENIEHQNHCACSADYFQIPVYESEIKNFNFSPNLHVFDVVQYGFNQAVLPQTELIQIFDNGPPITHYQDISTHIIHCSFLC